MKESIASMVRDFGTDTLNLGMDVLNTGVLLGPPTVLFAYIFGVNFTITSAVGLVGALLGVQTGGGGGGH